LLASLSWVFNDDAPVVVTHEGLHQDVVGRLPGLDTKNATVLSVQRGEIDAIKQGVSL
jgi:hypothetical protein